MSVNRILIKDNGVVIDDIDFRKRVYSNLTTGSHTISVEAYYNDVSVGKMSKDIIIDDSNLDPDYANVLMFATNNNIPLPTADEQQRHSDMLTNYKVAGGWFGDDVFFYFGGTADPAFKLIDWKRLVKATAFGDLDFQETGVYGNNFNAYIDTLYDPSLHGVNWTLENHGINLHYIYVTRTSNTICSTDITQPGKLYLNETTNSNNRHTKAMNGDYMTGYGYWAKGDMPAGVHRLDDPTNIVSYIDQDVNANKGDHVETNPVTEMASGNLFLLGRNNGGTADVFSPDGLKWFALGKGMTRAEFDQIKTTIS
jgi:hypothetical protein